MTVRNYLRAAVVACAFVGASALVIGVAHARSGEITVFPLPDQTDFDGPDFPLVGPDGNIWFVEYGTNKIGLIDPKPPNAITEFALPSNISTGIVQMTVGPDGNVWFVTGGSVDYLLGGTPGTVGRILAKPPYTITEFPPPFPTYSTARIAIGADGNIWFTASPGQGSPPGSAEKILTISPFGSHRMTTYDTPANASIGWLLPGHRDDFFFYGQAGADKHNVVGRFSIKNPAVAQFLTVPGGGGPSYVGPTDLIMGPDANIWFPDWTSINDFSLTTRHIDQVGVYPQAIGLAFGEDGNLWFTTANFGTADITRLEPTYPYRLTQYPVPLPNGASVNNYEPNHMVSGPDGNLWATMVVSPGGALLRISVK